jgi:hypothetical protein
LRVVYRTAATSIALLHFAFILFVVFGGLLVLRWPRLMFLHIPAAIWGSAIEFGGWVCPLTRWENQFLRLAGHAGYHGGFLQRYLFAIIYPSGLTRTMEVILGLVVLAINVAVYARLATR